MTTLQHLYSSAKAMTTCLYNDCYGKVLTTFSINNAGLDFRSKSKYRREKVPHFTRNDHLSIFLIKLVMMQKNYIKKLGHF